MTAFAQDISMIKKPRLISLQSFLKRYSDIEDGYKYEYNNGIIEKTKTMNQEQTTLFAALLRVYITTQSFQEGGTITSETNMNTTDVQLRKPDIAIYSADQLKLMRNGQNQIAEWVAEVISDTDNINRVNKKVEEYFEAGVKVVWHIFPNIETVYVYTAADVVTICKGSKICSGAPAVSDFEISAANLFAKN
jgi:Uma2 family endonuclease